MLAYLKIPGLEGESTKSPNIGWIPILEYSHRVTNTIPTLDTPNMMPVSDHCEHGGFSISKLFDKSSAGLFLHCCNATVIPEAKLEIREEFNGRSEMVLCYVFKDTIIGSYLAEGGIYSNELRPAETIILRYSRIGLTYRHLEFGNLQVVKDVLHAHWNLQKQSGEMTELA